MTNINTARKTKAFEDYPFEFDQCDPAETFLDGFDSGYESALLEAQELNTVLQNRTNELESRTKGLVEALEYVSRVTYGTEISNSEAENNEILARHFFNSQAKAREALKQMSEAQHVAKTQ